MATPQQTSVKTSSSIVAALRSAAVCVHRLVAGRLAPVGHWPEVLAAAGECGLWACPVPLLNVEQVQGIIVAVEVRGGRGGGGGGVRPFAVPLTLRWDSRRRFPYT